MSGFGVSFGFCFLFMSFDGRVYCFSFGFKRIFIESFDGGDVFVGDNVVEY